MIDETFWVAVAFVGFLLLVYRPVARGLSGALDKRSKQIEEELTEAQRLREEAQESLAAYQKKHREISEEAEQILKAARDEAKAMQKKAAEEVKKAVESRIHMADQKIAHEEKKAIQDVQKQVVDIAVSAARNVIVDNLQKDADESLIKVAVKDINRIVH